MIGNSVSMGFQYGGCVVLREIDVL